MPFLLVFAAPALSGCASSSSVFGGSSGIMTLGPDTYSVSENVIISFGGAVAAQGQANQKATAYCASQNRSVLALHMETTPAPGSYVASLTFRCLAPNDPELQRPNYKRDPNVIVERRDR